MALRSQAVTLMQQALALLAEAGERDATSHLHMAHDLVAGNLQQSPQEDKEESGESESSPDPDFTSDLVLVKAVGGALAMLATFMSRRGVAPLDEIASALGVYAVISSESCGPEGAVIACWAQMLRDAAEAQSE